MPLTYQPYYRVHGAANWTPYGGPTSNTSVLISGLSAATQYDFQITAINAFGTANSTPVSATTLSAVNIISVTLSNQNFTAGQPIGTVVGSISVTMSSGSFTGTLAVSGADAGSFKIVGSQLQLNVGNTTARTYSVNIVATMATVNNSPFTQAFPNIIATASISESVEGFVVQGTDTSTIMYASTTRGVAQPSGPYLQFSMIPTNGNSVNLLAPGQSLITTASGSVSKIVYAKHACFQTNTSGGWWYWDTSKPFGPNNWNEFGVSSLGLSSFSYTLNAPINTVIGTISTIMITSTDTFSGTLTVSDATSSFKIVGTQLQAAKVLSAASYAITITATPYTTTDASAQVIGEVLSITPTLAVTGTVTAPAVAVAAGYNTLVWSDDFTTNTIAPTGTGFAAGKKWWMGNQDHVSNGDASINTTMTAATTPLGIGAGSNASANGGMLVMNSSNPNNGGNGFIMSTSNFATTLPTTAQGVFNKVYIECYIAYDPNVRIASGLGGALQYWFPAVWSWTWEGRQAGGFGGGGGSDSATSTEIDFMEEQSGLFGNGLGANIGFQGYFPGGGAAGTSFDGGSFPGITTPQWHTYGFLWDQSNNISFFRDGVRSGNPFLMTSVNGAFPNQHLFITMGTGYQWPMYCDWVRVWGLP